MDPKERFNNISVAMLAMLKGFQSSVWTALPGIVDSVAADFLSCSVRPAVQARLQDPTGAYRWVTISLLQDVPIVFPNGGGFSLTFPVAAGDECLVVLASRCIDPWWQSGAAGQSVVPPDLRMHSLSDGFAIIGPRSKPRALGGVSGNSAQLRSDDGSTYVEVAEGTVNIVANVVNVNAPNINLNASAEVKVTSPLTHLSGDIEAVGDMTLKKGTPDEYSMSTFVNDYNTHVHGGVLRGGANTDPPNNIVP